MNIARRIRPALGVALTLFCLTAAAKPVAKIEKVDKESTKKLVEIKKAELLRGWDQKQKLRLRQIQGTPVDCDKTYENAVQKVKAAYENCVSHPTPDSPLGKLNAALGSVDKLAEFCGAKTVPDCVNDAGLKQNAWCEEKIAELLKRLKALEEQCKECEALGKEIRALIEKYRAKGCTSGLIRELR